MKRGHARTDRTKRSVHAPRRAAGARVPQPDPCRNP